MSLLERLFAKETPAESRANWWESGMMLGESSAGIAVTPDSALSSSTVYACVRILAETLASLPLITYERSRDGGRRRATEFYLYNILHDEPNEWMTSFEYRETVQGHLALWGNAYSQIDYDAAGRVMSIFPLRPDRMLEIEVLNGLKRFKYQLPSGESKWLAGERVWHLKAFGDGLFGYSPVQLMRNGIGLTLATEKYGAKFFGNGARPGGVLEHPGKLGREAQVRLRENWNEMHLGLDNAHKVAILEEGMKWHEVGLPPGDAQYLETRKFQVTEIARMYRVPPHMVADLEHATFSNIEHQSLEFVNHTMMSWLARWEQSIKKHLMLPQERKRYYVEFLLDGLLRGDVASRTSYYAMGRQWGWLSTNDIREKENMNPVDGGNAYLQPLNMIEAGMGAPDDQAESATRQEGAAHSQGRREKNFDEAWEFRVRAAAGERLKLAGRHQRVFADAAARILRRERNDVLAMAKKMLGNGPAVQFEAWLNKFYEGHASWSAEQMLPVMLAYGELAADQVRVELEADGDLAGQIRSFIEAYAEAFGKRESGRSLTRLLETVRAEVEAEAQKTAVEEKLNAWVEERPEAIAHEETVRENNAVAVALYERLGVLALISVATGASSCPYCKALDGKRIGITEFFLLAGQEFNPDGAPTPLTVTHSKRHSPYHAGCDCMVVAGL